MASVHFGLLDSWTAEHAWWWGVLLGDGNVYESAKDAKTTVVGSRSTTARWGALIAPDVVAHEFKHSVGTYQVCVNSKALVARCKARGVYGPKSHALPWPADVPTAALPHFLRGLWDTDGSLSIFDRAAHGHRGNPEVKARFASACSVFVERLRDAVETLCAVPRVALVESRKGVFRTYGISYAGSSAMKVADALYADAPEHLRNEDRVEVYRRMCALRDHLAEACACGRPATRQGKCQKCWWAAKGRTTGPGTVCTRCGVNPISHKDICGSCASRDRRAQPGWARKSTGTCACGQPAYRKGQCDACYARAYRAAKGVPGS